MATRSLLDALAFRKLAVALPTVSRITVRYGVDYSACAGHAAARCVLLLGPPLHQSTAASTFPPFLRKRHPMRCTPSPYCPLTSHPLP